MRLHASAIVPRKGQKNAHSLNLNTRSTDSLEASKNATCTITLTRRVEADITSLLGIKAPTELCCKKCRRMQASSHNQAGGGVRGMGGGDDSDGAVILCSASAVRYRVAAIRSTI